MTHAIAGSQLEVPADLCGCRSASRTLDDLIDDLRVRWTRLKKA